MPRPIPLALGLLALGGAAACAGEPRCDVVEPAPWLPTLDCQLAFDLQKARPLKSSLSGAHTVKTVIDRAAGDAVHFQNTTAYPLHQAFAVDHLGWPPGVPFFTEYFSPHRRLLLGAVTYYEDPGVFAYEIAPYDTASAEMIADSIGRIAGAAFFGKELHFHPTSREQLERAAELPKSIRVITTEELYAGATYQALNLGETIAQVRLLTVAELESGYVSPRELAVLDRVPNDISVVAGVVTEEFQTPLSHVNVLSHQRGTPNMALRGARERFREHDGRFVRLRVGAFDYELEPATREEADAWFEANRPAPVVPPAPDYTVEGFVDLGDITLADLPAVGGKAAHVGELRRIEGVRAPQGFAIPVSHYLRFLEDNGFDEALDAMTAEPRFHEDAAYRRERLVALETAMQAAPVNAELLAAIEARLNDQFPETRMRFRSSTTAEDLAGFSAAGIYRSRPGAVGDPKRRIEDALRSVWSSAWTFRAYEELTWVGIDPREVAMGILVNPSYRNQTANGIAITANLFDPAPGGEDAFYLNVQLGDVSVALPPASAIYPDQVIYFFYHQGQPATYLTTSNLVSRGDTVLSRAELFDLGRQLDRIRTHFRATYEPPAGFARLPMDVEFKRLPDGAIEVKQARPHPGRGH
jgi:pyruvate, water dikinase